MTTLSDQHQAIIAGIPTEGTEPFLLASHTHSFLSRLAFAGKQPGEGSKRARILFGHPGSGKSFLFSNASENDEAVISYDEGGAIFDIAEYAQELKKLGFNAHDEHTPVGFKDASERRKLWRHWQNDSQRIRGMTLKTALEDGYNLIIDTTSTSIGTQYLIKALRGLDYQEISMDGAFAPFMKARQRVLERLRPTTLVGDLVEKRIASYDWLQTYAPMVDQFRFFYNPSNEQEPQLAFRLEKGDIVQADDAALQHIQRDILDEGIHIRAHLETITQRPDIAAPEDVSTVNIDKIMEKHAQQSRRCVDFLQMIRGAGMRLSHAPSGPALKK